jgi:hypothetical protein
MMETKVTLKPYLGCIFSRIAGETSIFCSLEYKQKWVRKFVENNRITGRKEELPAFLSSCIIPHKAKIYRSLRKSRSNTVYGIELLCTSSATTLAVLIHYQ